MIEIDIYLLAKQLGIPERRIDEWVINSREKQDRCFQDFVKFQ